MKRVRRFRSLMCVILIISILFSIYTPVSAADESEEYETIAVEVEFSDNVGESEYLTFMQTDENVYVSASELAMRLGYQVSVSEDYVVFLKTRGDSNPPEHTFLYFDSTEVMHTIFSMEVDGYEAPFPSIKNGEDAWVPFEYTLLILGSSVAVIDGTFCIDMPDTTIIDIFYDVLKNGETYSFDWERDFGYSNLDVDIIGSSSHLINLFNGMLKFDGDSWAQLFESIVLDSSAYDSKYGEDIALLLCTESDNELKAEVKEMQKFTDLLSEDGKLGKMLTTYSANIDANVESCTKTCETILEKVQNGNSSIAQYNKSYQALEKALDKQIWFSDTGENILVVQKGLSDVTTFLDAAITVLEVVGYAEEFQNQDEFSIDALSMVLDGQSENSIASEVMLESMQEYVEYLKTDILEYSTRRYFDENLDSWIKKALGISEALGTQANIELLAWSLISSFVPRLSDSLSAADKFELALYAYVYATDANNTFRTSLWDTLFTDNDVTAESMYTLSQQCYISLKSWYITREAAVSSLKGKSSAVQEQIQPLIDEQNSVNEEIAELLVILKNADTTNESLIYGFLPEDNESYLETYADGEEFCLLVLETIASESAVDVYAAYDVILDEYREACSISYEEYLANPEKYEQMYPDVNADVMYQYHVPYHASSSGDGTDESYELAYAYYDIDQNGTLELLIILAFHEFYICDFYAFNGTSAVKLFPDITFLDDEVGIIYTDGTICVSAGESTTLYRLNDDGYTLSSISWEDWVEAYDVPEYYNNWELLAEDISYDGGDTWKEAYIQYIYKKEASNTETSEWAQYAYSLIYVDDNEIPELYVLGLSEAEGDRICTIGGDGSVVECVLPRTYGSSYIEYSGLICNFNGNSGYFYLQFYQLKDGEIIEINDAYGWEIVEYDSNENEILTYEWNDKEVTEEEFYANWNAIMNLDALLSPWETTYNAENIIAMIQES